MGEMKREGLVLGMPEDEYHGGPEFSSSAAKEILKSPLHYKHVYIDGHREPKKAWDIGTAAHAMVLGTGAETVVIPEALLAANGAASTKAAKDFMTAARAAGQTPVKQGEFDDIKRMANAVLSNKEARLLFEQDRHSEASVFSSDAATGVRQRCRFDTITKSLLYAGDLKTTDDIAPQAVKMTVKKFKYHVQREMYDEIAAAADIELIDMLFIFVEKKAPHDVVVYKFDEDLREMGKREAAAARERLVRCRETGIWPGRYDGIQLLKPAMAQVYDFQDEYESETL